jgi:mersacidin/lichenicidin family type 2 lantibiotic
MRVVQLRHTRLLLREEEYIMDLVRSWKDPEYRFTLTATAPAHPSGEALSALSDDELVEVSGAGTGVFGTMGCCGCLPWYSGWTVCGLVCNPGHPCSN